MIKRSILYISIILTFLSACQPQVSKCQQSTGFPKYLTDLPLEELSPVTPRPAEPASEIIEIGRKLITVDKVIEGPLCNDTWKGTVYVTCNVQVFAWEDQPTFLKNCDLKIDPDTVIYVAYHNDTAYYNGCSCHTGEITEP